jgi:hypothetical protein
MPQHPGNNTKKKKKGRAPAHQNTFAFKHNPKSKKTEKILESPILHCCRRCRDKLEWRKKYRKYKPRTQLGSCNLCREKRVKYAYHTICTKCTTCDRAWHVMREAQEKIMLDAGFKEVADDEVDNDNDEEDVGGEPAVDDVKLKGAAAGLLRAPSNPHRVCAICVKEVALPDEGGPEHSIEDIVARMGPMSLRQRRGLERQLLKQQEELEGGPKAIDNDQDGNDDDESDVDNVDDTHEDGSEDEVEGDIRKVFDDCDEDDPFLQAIGGADKLLIGEAYQKMLLAKQNVESSGST